MCWTKYYKGDHKCIGRFQTRERQAALREAIATVTDPNDLPEIITCTGGTVHYTWVDDGIYSYDGHVQGFKQYITAYCKECGARWVESPENAEWIIDEFGADCDWRLEL